MNDKTPAVPDLKPYLAAAIEASTAAAEEIMSEFGGPIACDQKPDLTPVTDLDIRAESVIRTVLLSSFPDHGFIGEESEHYQTDSRYVWVVDPIDGTSCFSRGIPLFAIEIALMVDGTPVVGVSNAPALGEMLFASVGAGAYRNGERVHTSRTSSIGRAFLAYGHLEHFASTSRLAQLTQLISSVSAARGYSDAFSYHLLATGHLDVVVEAKTKLWDVAALTVIVEEAGGRMTDLSGKPITEDLEGALATNSGLYDQTLALLQGLAEKRRHDSASEEI